MNEKENPSGSLSVLDRVVDAGSHLPAPLAYGVLIIVCIVLLSIAPADLPQSIHVLFAVVVLATLVSYVYLDSGARQHRKSPEEIIETLREAFARKTFDEPLPECKRQNWIDRFKGTCEAYDVLKQLKESVDARGSDELKSQFADLRTHVDGYRDDIAKHLLKESKFTEKKKNGDIKFIPQEIEKDCEGHRNEIRRIVDGL
jgi:hypothetical protein